MFAIAAALKWDRLGETGTGWVENGAQSTLVYHLKLVAPKLVAQSLLISCSISHHRVSCSFDGSFNSGLRY